jgi:protein ImuB
VPRARVAREANAERLAALNAEARAAGLHIGQTLAEARAILPALVVAPHDPAADARLLAAIAEWCDRYTPLVALTPPDGLMLDITGAAHLVGGEAALAADLRTRLTAQSFTAETAIAPTAGAAWGLARFGLASPVIDEDLLEDALAPLPVAALRIDPDTAAGLDRVGLKTIGDLMQRPRSPLAARFGAPLLWRLDQALGRDQEAINPRRPVPPAVVEARLAEPLMREADVATVAANLARDLCHLLEERGHGASALELAVFRVDGHVRRMAIGTAAPSRDAGLIIKLIGLKLGHLADPLEAGFGFDLVRLAATAVEPCDARAHALPAIEDDPALAEERVVMLADRLAARFGRGAVLRPMLADTHWPEAAATLAPFAPRTGERTPPHAVSPTGAALRAALRASLAHEDRLASVRRDVATPTLGPARPLRLFHPPEPVEIIAEVPDGPPLRLRWRRRSLRIVAAEGPERIAALWWQGKLRENTRPRDYYRVADETGRRLWVFRDGLYSTQGPPPRWFVHGLFA